MVSEVSTVVAKCFPVWGFMIFFICFIIIKVEIIFILTSAAHSVISYIYLDFEFKRYLVLVTWKQLNNNAIAIEIVIVF